MPPTIFDQFLAGDLFGVPIPIIAIIILIVLVIYFIATRTPRDKEFKGLDMKKEVRRYLNELYGLYNEPVNKKLTSGLIRLGYVKGFMPLMWNKKLNLIENIKDRKKRLRKEELKRKKEGKEDKPEKNNPDDIIEMIVLTRCSSSFPKKQLSKLLGVFTKYMIIDKTLLRFDENEVYINSHVTPTSFYGVLIYTKSAKKFIENVSFRINRENELQEIANQIPRTVFFDTALAKAIASKRETARIEREKYKGQIEGGEEA